MAIDYKQAGVDVTRGYKAVELMKQHTKSTYDENVLCDLGSFGGMYSLCGSEIKNPVLVSGTDGVGTKLKYAFIKNRHDTIGIDCVAMCANDVVCHGAKPLFFLDYLATGRLVPEVAASIVSGVSEGCRQAGCALIGGETAEMPGFYPDGEYDLAGFCVGIVDRDKVINGKNIVPGDTLIGIASSGIHSNGYSLVRKLFGENISKLDTVEPRLGSSVIDALLKPTKIYVRTILKLIEEFEIKGIAHITGGGFIENIPRMFPEGIDCTIDVKAFPEPPIYAMIRERSGLNDDKLFNTFNMGIGMVICVNSADETNVLKRLKELGESAYIIGKTVKGKQK